MSLEEFVLHSDYRPVATQSTPGSGFCGCEVQVFDHVAGDQGASATHPSETMNSYCSRSSFDYLQEAFDDLKGWRSAVREEEIVELETDVTETEIIRLINYLR